MTAFLYGVCIAIFVLIDQIVKKAVLNNIALSQVILVIKDFFYITYVRNYGAGFSILQNATLFLIALSVIACIVLFYLLMTAERNDLISKMSYLLIISGAIGNLIDRIRFGYVIDFLDFKIQRCRVGIAHIVNLKLERNLRINHYINDAGVGHRDQI